jgi:hypothetical protein
MYFMAVIEMDRAKIIAESYISKYLSIECVDNYIY